MTNVTERVESISDFSDFVQDRGLELVKAKGYTRKLLLDKIEFDTTSVGVTFQEDRHHDCPDYEYVDLSIAQLEMNDLDWKAYVDGVKNETFMAEVDKIKLAKERELANKERDYLKLKQELGY